jgi:hypothetical protein
MRTLKDTKIFITSLKCYREMRAGQVIAFCRNDILLLYFASRSQVPALTGCLIISLLGSLPVHSHAHPETSEIVDGHVTRPPESSA